MATKSSSGSVIRASVLSLTSIRPGTEYARAVRSGGRTRCRTSGPGRAPRAAAPSAGRWCPGRPRRRTGPARPRHPGRPATGQPPYRHGQRLTAGLGRILAAVAGGGRTAPPQSATANGGMPGTAPNRHNPGLPGGRALRAPARWSRRSQPAGSARLRVVVAVRSGWSKQQKTAWCLGRVAHVQQVAGAVGRIGEPGQPGLAGTGRLRLDHEHVLRGQPGQREPPAGRRTHRPPVEDRAGRRGGQLGERGRPGLPAPEPDLGPRPDRTRRPAVRSRNTS